MKNNLLCDNSSDIIEPNYSNLYNKKPTKIVDTFPYYDDNGNFKYIEEEAYYQKLEEQKNKVLNMVKEIEKNNPLNFNENNNKPRNNKESNNDIIVDFYSKPKKFNFKFSLKKIACTIGIAIGISSAIKSTQKYHINTNYSIKNENNKDIKQKKKDKLQTQKIKKINKQNHYHTHLKKITLKDEFQLNDTNFYYNSNGDNPCVKSKKLNCDSYQIRYIAIVSNDCKKVLNVIKINSKNNQMSIDEFISYYKSLYGNNIRFQINVDGIIDGKIIYKNIGWTSIKNIKLKKIITTKVKKLTLM